ncbi:hypothetical protein [Absidia glauca]|uniref:Uncharacterized protein n=1 Tax=Absidia glauca TaxID=4829 RepID=A0A168M5I6_ABSGL|nr:hypothetical protein [Absidia glauca]
MPIPILVDCTWPCPGGNDHACVLNETALSCQPKQNSQWIWSDPQLSPQYDGEPARLHQPCITIPLHHLPRAKLTNTTATTTVNWPPNDPAHPMDRYLSDCNESTFCEEGSCVPKRSSGSPCVSTHQCQDGLCHEEACQSLPTPPPTQHQKKEPENKNGGEGDNPWSTQPAFTTPHIVGVVVAVVVLLSAIAIFFYCYRRRKQRVTTDQKSQTEEDLPIEAPSLILPMSHLPTPSVQQQQLQFQLQRHHPPSSPSGPPPYSP